MTQVTVNFHTPHDATVAVDHEGELLRAELFCDQGGDYVLTGPRETSGRRFAAVNASPRATITAYLRYLGIDAAKADVVEFHSDQGTGELGTLTGSLDDVQRIRDWAEVKANLNASNALDNLRQVARRLTMLLADHGKGGDA